MPRRQAMLAESRRHLQGRQGLTSLKADIEWKHMSSIAVITAIIVLLAALVCYAFVTQTLTQKRQQRERLAAAMKTRVRNFKFMLSALPAGFLNKELLLLVQRSLMQVLEQLTRLEPSNSTHTQELQSIAQQMAETQRQPPHPPAPAPLESTAKAQETKACLEELYKFIYQLEGKKGMTPAQAENYRLMIRQLVLQLTVDSYVMHGRAARDKEKPRLAIHYFDLALKLMLRERSGGQFEARIKQLQSLLAELELQSDAAPAAGVIPGAEADQELVSEQWDKFEKEGNWKKKQIYD